MELAELRAHEAALYRFLDTHHPAILVLLDTRQRIDEEIALHLDAALAPSACVSPAGATRAAA
jgi:hypothetical protein